MSVAEQTNNRLVPVTATPKKRRHWPTTLIPRQSASHTSSTIDAVVDVIQQGGKLDDDQQQIALAAMQLAHAQRTSSLFGSDRYLQPVVDEKLAENSGRFGYHPPESFLLSWDYCRRYAAIDMIRMLLVTSSPVAPEAEAAVNATIQQLMAVNDLGRAPDTIGGSLNTQPADESAATPTKEAAGS